MFVCYTPTPVSVHDLLGYNGHVNILNLELVRGRVGKQKTPLLYNIKKKKTLEEYREEHINTRGRDQLHAHS